MSTPTRTSEIRDRLLIDHGTLRGLMIPCEQEARRVMEAGTDSRHLLACILQLLDALEGHNRAEEEALEPLLLDSDSFGSVRLDQMIEDHGAEHLELRQALREAVEAEVPDRAARATLAAIARLREHLTREERQFLNVRVLKDDIMPIDTSSG